MITVILLKQGMVTTFPQCNFRPEFPESLSKMMYAGIDLVCFEI